MKGITPFLWFDDQAEEAAKFYVSVFKNSKIKHVEKYPKAAEEVSGKKAGSVMTVAFELNGQEFIAINGGPHFSFSEAVSFVVNCEDQSEIDYYWEKLSAHKDSEMCGWLKDKYGVSWQITPANLESIMKDRGTEKVMAAVLKMKKIDIETLKAA